MYSGAEGLIAFDPLTILGQSDVTQDHVFGRGCVSRCTRQEEHDFARVPQQNRGGSSPTATKEVRHYTSEVSVEGPLDSMGHLCTSLPLSYVQGSQTRWRGYYSCG